ncbi:MAG: M67 family metallopeptidase [Sneathiellales bacterium]|nr:M67 family metallopeptidase [Sneathiellales bacterium]
MHLELQESDYKKLNEHAASCWPEEACALLIGLETASGIRAISRIEIARNIASDPQRFFEVDPACRIRLEKELRQRDEYILGIFHSHPDGVARPSDTDAQRIYEKDMSWLIASADNEGITEIGAFHPATKYGFDNARLTIRQDRKSGNG